jgi:hypothetical protein
LIMNLLKRTVIFHRSPSVYLSIHMCTFRHVLFIDIDHLNA